MFIKNYGLFWRVDEINWKPGKGKRNSFRLLGRQGKNVPTIKLAHFRHQKGIYILYGNHGPYYVGLTKKRGLGVRLLEHYLDEDADAWDRFSWFGFCAVLKRTSTNGIQELRQMAKERSCEPGSIITDVEELLIRAMGLSNINKNNFCDAQEWFQVKLDETDACLAKVQK